MYKRLLPYVTLYMRSCGNNYKSYQTLKACVPSEDHIYSKDDLSSSSM